MRQTSRDAYRAIFEQLPAKRGQVLAALLDAEQSGLCDVQIAERLGWPINCVTPRRGELEQMGYIESVGLSVSPHTHTEVHFWKIRDAALEPGFVPNSLGSPKCRRSRTVSVREAARVMVEHRRKLRRVRLRTTALPLFEGAK